MRSATMAVNPRDMDGFMPLLSTTDIKKKLNVGSLLLNYLGDVNKSIECQDIGQFIDNIIPWLSNGNPKVTFFFLIFLCIIIHVDTLERVDFANYGIKLSGIGSHNRIFSLLLYS